MIEDFAIDYDGGPYPLEDWQLQMNRVLGLIVQDKVIIAQSVVGGDQGRMFALGSYLLVKGSRTYLNVIQGEGAELYPEYDILIGTPSRDNRVPELHSSGCQRA